MKRKTSQIQQTALLPDLLAIPATDFQIEEVESDGNTKRLLRFSQAFGNIGRGALQVRRGQSARYCRGKNRAIAYQDIFLRDGSKRSIPLKECMIYHPVHKHWHVANIARYDLCEVDTETGGIGAVVSSSDKISFCLIDEIPLDRSQYRGPRYRKYYTSCHTRISGIRPGWADEYDYKVYGQWVDITDLEDGVYYLRTTVNPKKLLRERTYRNNVAWVKIRIEDDGEEVEIIDEDQN